MQTPTMDIKLLYLYHASVSLDATRFWCYNYKGQVSSQILDATIFQKEHKCMYIDEPLQNYLNDLASSQSTPGGGSASALSGALGAGLASMVARFTLDKPDYANVQQEMELLVEKTEVLRTRFQQLMQEDIDVYGKLSACYKMPRTTDEEKTARTQAIQARLHDAALVPLEVTECAAEVLQHCQRIAEIGSKNLVSDIATGTMLASSAGTGASWMVRTNLLHMKDLALVDALSDRLNTALDTIATCSQQVITLVGEKE